MNTRFEFGPFAVDPANQRLLEEGQPIAVTPKVYRGPYEYSVPGHTADFTPQHQPEGA